MMFSRRGHADVKKSAQKALDPRKDLLTRLKHLKALMDALEGSELKQFFESNYSQIYFIFFESFTTIETSLKQKGNKSQREELDSILFLFERILQLLPERIFCRWHFHSIGSVLKKLLHSGNCLKIRCEGIRLFILWLQALQTNCAEEQLLLFACLVPGFPAVISSKGPCTLDILINPPPVLSNVNIYPEEITPLLPHATGEKIEDPTCYFLQLLLKCMVIQAASLEWKNKANLDTGFKFLFALFRKYYLPHLFPSFIKVTNLYNPVLDFPGLRPKSSYVSTICDNGNFYSTQIPYIAARVVFIKWLVSFFLEKKYLPAIHASKNGVEVLPRIIQTGGNTAQDKNPEVENSVPSDQEKNYINNSLILNDSSFCSIEEHHRPAYEMVQQTLLSTRDYVNFVNEIFHQAFLLPSSEISLTEKVVKVYRKWILQEKPAFMEEPDAKAVQDDDGVTEHSSTETDGKHVASGHKRSSSWGRTYSFSSAVTKGCILEDENKNIKAGLQPTLQVFLTNSANVFLLEPCSEVPELLKEQVNSCKAVLSIYRHMIMELPMNKKTWEHMLQILLSITEAVMSGSKDDQIKNSFAQSLAGLLFRTLIVAWIRANLSVYISRELWDELLRVLSSLTDWEELIIEWANIMDSLTSVLARTVYDVEMTNLPLEKLSEQKEKRQKGKGGVLESQKGAAVGRSFSLSWRDHPETVEPMRFRSATTSGVPGIEKARNIVRQRAAAKRSQSINNCARLCEALPTTKSVPLLLHTVSSLLPDISYTSYSCMFSEAEQYEQSENGTGIVNRQPVNLSRVEHSGLFSDQEQLIRSSSTSDIRDQCNSHIFQVRKTESSQNLDSNSISVQESKEPVSKERTVQEESNPPPELNFKADMQESHGNHTDKEKCESISSDTSVGYNSEVGYNNEVVMTLAPWQACEENHDFCMQSDLSLDPDAQQWLYRNSSQATNLTDSSEFLADDCSIIAGGNLTGWHPDSAAVLWRRTLGILGDVNSIQSPKIHSRVFEYLFELWHKLAKIRDNLAISLDNQSTPSPPALIPPLRIFASWLLKATCLPDEYKKGKIHAYKLICAMMTRRQDFVPNPDYLVHFYLVMHIGLTNKDQDVLNTIIKHCSPFFFFLGLPGFTLLIGDFIAAASRVLNTNMLEVPRLEANTILGSLICFPNLYQNISLLPSVAEAEITTGTADVKFCLTNNLMKNARDEPSEAARCLALCCLGLWICEELVHSTNHPQVKDAINVFGVTLKFPNKQIAQTACDILQLLTSYWEKLQKYNLSLPRKIIEILVATIAFLLPSAEYSSMESDKKFIVSLLLCLLDWCMTLPVKILLEPVHTSSFENQYSSNTPLLNYIYRILNSCVYGSSTYTQQSHYLLSLADLSSEMYDPFLPLGNVRNSELIPFQSSAALNNLLTVAEERKRRSVELIPLTARMVMAHLVNNLGHYPLIEGPAVLHSLMSENHNNSYTESSELSPEVFRSPNLQLFEFNDNTVISYLQIPSEREINDEPEETFSEVRVIVRDISGKYSWDGRLMHGLLVGCSPDQKRRKSSEIMEKNKQNFETPTDVMQICEGEDALDKLLERIGNSSPECLLYPQVKLNEPSPSPSVMSHDQVNDIIEAIMQQSCNENEYTHGCNLNYNAKKLNQKPPRSTLLQSPFHLCRLLLNDLGMNSWEKRKSFNVLKKNSKLLRELKNLDSRQCRETHKIAVVYIAEGQEDKCSILSNAKGSQSFEDFIAGLGWEVDLSTHCGFMGGLQRNGSTGQTAPYYATSTVEVIFHVSTRMPSDSDDSLTKKLRHLGNDEVHVIWSEHTRNYRRGIIPTDFGDVLIIIYPMKNHMFYIEIMKKAEVPFFGPLFNGAIVTATLLPNLIRATCINASRAVKSLITLYQSLFNYTSFIMDVFDAYKMKNARTQMYSRLQGFLYNGDKLLSEIISGLNLRRYTKLILEYSSYEERALYLDAIIQNHKELLTFEDFAAQVFSPSPSYSRSGCGALTTSLSSDLIASVRTESAEQIAPTLATAAKNKLFGKLS